jgi:hypothetical protein
MEKKAKQRKVMTLDTGRSALHYTDPLVDRFAATKKAQCIIHLFTAPPSAAKRG